MIAARGGLYTGVYRQQWPQAATQILLYRIHRHDHFSMRIMVRLDKNIRTKLKVAFLYGESLTSLFIPLLLCTETCTCGLCLIQFYRKGLKTVPCSIVVSNPEEIMPKWLSAMWSLQATLGMYKSTLYIR